MSFIKRLFKIVKKDPVEVEEVPSKPILPKPRKKRVSKPKKINISTLSHPEIFDGCDEGQKQAILSDNPRTLVLAGAGAGKTRVLLKRILHLIQNKEEKSGNILAMTFTKFAANEMYDRLLAFYEPKYKKVLEKKLSDTDLKYLRNDQLKKHSEIRHVTIKTIHALCYQILRRDGAKVFNTNFKVVGDEEKNNKSDVSQQQIIRTLIYKKEPDFIQKIKEYILDYLVELEESLENSNNKSYGKYITLDGKKVRSKSERAIANYLYEHGIKYNYEKEVIWINKVDKTKNYKPDFYLPDFDVYIEHWFISKESDNVPENYNFDKIKYLKERKWKLNQFKTHNKKLIESFETQMQGDLAKYYDYLYKELVDKTGRTIKQKPSLEAIEEMKHVKQGFYLLCTGLMKIINLAKSNRISTEQIKDRLKEEKHNEVLEFYNILLIIYDEYVEYLISESLIDYNDMIHKVVELFSKHPTVLAKYQKKFKHILVDEYQDVSAAQVELIKQLLTEDNYLFAVGDDWQSIYQFRGSEVEYIINFKEDFNDANVVILPYNYRSAKNIVEASNIVIMKNPQQIIKKIQPFNKTSKEKIFQFNSLNDLDAAQFIMDATKKLYSTGYKFNDIMLLYRRSIHLWPYKKFFEKHNFKINTKTIHGSKGLEAKVVFLVGLKMGSDGFPYVWEDKRIVQIIKETKLDRKEEEERRIFYVAMTRAKEKLFLISEKGNESKYCEDIPQDFKKVQISKSEFNEEMLGQTLLDTLTQIKNKKTVADMAKERDVEEKHVESQVAKLIFYGLLNVYDFMDEKTYNLIKSKVNDVKKSTRLTPIKKELPNTITYAEIRYVLADLRSKDK